MTELHPAIVHFPVALLTIAALFAAVSLFKKKELFKEIAFWNLLLGVIGSIAAVLTGFVEEQNLVHNDEIHKVLTKHKFAGLGILILSFALLTWIWVRKNRFGKGEYLAWVLFLVLGTAAVFYQGFLGGKMVFEQGAGVQPMEMYMEQEKNSTQSHGHSNSDHGHNNDPDIPSSKKATFKKTHHAPSPSVNEHSNAGSSAKKQDSITIKEKKKELKDMKY